MPKIGPKIRGQSKVQKDSNIFDLHKAIYRVKLKMFEADVLTQADVIYSVLSLVNLVFAYMMFVFWLLLEVIDDRSSDSE